MTKARLESVLESILFVADQPISLKELAETTGMPIGEVSAALECLTAELLDRGIRVTRSAERYHLVSAPEHAEAVAKFLHKELRGNLSATVVETLAIVAYKQPVTRGEIEEIRGTPADYAIRQLLVRGLIEPKGRRDGLGRPMEYATTAEFMNHLGITDQSNLPALPDLAPDEAGPDIAIPDSSS